MADDWFANTDQDVPPDQGTAETATKTETETETAQDSTGEDKRETAEDEYLDPNKLLLFKHWIRPKFHQYKYLYDYRYNYYNDVIDYLDKKQRGLRRDIPHPQTWAERTLRTYNSQLNKVESFGRLVDDTKLVTQTKLSGYFHLNYSKNYINRRFSSILV